MSICLKNMHKQLQASDVVRILLIRDKIKLTVSLKNMSSWSSLLIEDTTACQLLIAIRTPLAIEFHEFPLINAVRGQLKPLALTFKLTSPFSYAIS